MIFLSHKTGSMLILISVAALLLVSCTESVAPTFNGSPVRIVEPKSIQDLETAFQRFSYDFDQIEKGIPPVIFSCLPKEIPQLNSSSQKKELFLKTLLPMVLLANQEISLQRSKLLQLETRYHKGQSLTSEQTHLIETLQQKYTIAGDPQALSTYQELKKRVDIIPTSLALAQAANESAWGSSRFSQQGNNLFGEWTFAPGTGIIPEGRPEGATYEVKRFTTLYESIRSYAHNLNTHRAYKKFRMLRFAARQKGETLKGVPLADGLVQYSTRRQDYILDLQALMRQNNLQRFAQAQLRQG